MMTHSLVNQIRWTIDSKPVSMDDTWISTSYMNRGQERNISDPGLLKQVSVIITEDAFVDIIAPLFEEVRKEEENEAEYNEGEYWVADMFRKYNFEPFPQVWDQSRESITRFALEFESELLDALWVEASEWKDHNYYMHELNGYKLHKNEIEFTGTAIYAPFFVETLLKNLINNISDPNNTCEILIDSMKALAQGGEKAVEALPKIELLKTHHDRDVSALAIEIASELSVFRNKH